MCPISFEDFIPVSFVNVPTKIFLERLVFRPKPRDMPAFPIRVMLGDVKFPKLLDLKDKEIVNVKK